MEDFNWFQCLFDDFIIKITLYINNVKYEYETGIMERTSKCDI
jgi:hypothetical protein